MSDSSLPSSERNRSAASKKRRRITPKEARLVPFRAVVTVVELDVERRPEREFTAQTMAISCAQLKLHSRRMVYTGSPILIILPLLDSTPCVVGCLVTNCIYDSAGDYLITLEFSNHARSRFVEDWMLEHGYSIWKPMPDEIRDPDDRRTNDDDKDRLVA